MQLKDINNTDTHLTPEEERSPLVGRQHYALTLVKAGAAAVCCAVLTIGTTVTAVIYFKPKHQLKSTPKLQYSFSTPYEGAGTIAIHNDNNYEIQILDIQFVTNAQIPTGSSGSVYGELAAGGQAALSKLSTANNAITYKLTEPTSQKISLGPMTSKSFTYVFNQALGIVDVAVLPTGVGVTTSSGSMKLSIAQQCQGQSCEDPFKGKVVGGYYTDWDMYGRQYPAEKIPVNKLNTIYYAFINYNRSGDISLLDPYSDNKQLPALMQLQQQHPYLKILLSFGGWTLSSEFPFLAQNPTARINFSKNVLAMLQQFNFAGIDIDWEYPSSSDSNNFVLLLKTLREQLDASGKKYLITLATSAGEDKISAIGNGWKEIAKYVDYINLMAYDFNGPWSSVSDYQSALSLPPNDPNGQALAINGSIPIYERYGFPKEKIALGLPAYFRGVKVANMQTNGMWQPVTGTPAGQYDASGVFEYNCAVSKTCYGGSQMPADCTLIDEQHSLFGNYSRTPSIVCPSESSLYTGDSTMSIQDKCQYAIKNNLKGVFFWALAGDERTNEQKSLLSTAANAYSNPAETSEKKALNSGHTEPMAIHNEEQWQAFISQLKINLGLSYFGGIAFTGMFQLIDKLSDRIVKRFIEEDKDHPTIEMQAYYALKSVVYLSIMYYIGIPLLPAIASRVITHGLHAFGCSPLSASVSGITTSACLTLASTVDLTNPQAILVAVGSFLSATAGSFTVTHFGSISRLASKANNWARGLNFFSVMREQKDVEGMECDRSSLHP